ncbi:MAG: hypothetical protein C4567_06020 [Deltaproteobacteria bacterium]|nr:MAG: hypothetical protein C4567_06020 [Deltaproteobacteria bacterium]
MRRLTAILILAVSLFLAQTAAAENLLVNGGFETGDFNGWTKENPFGEVSQERPYEGQWSASLNSGEMKLSQTIATTPGQVYQVSFWYAGGSDQNNYLEVKWDGEVIYGNSSFSYSNHKFVNVIQSAAGASAKLEFIYTDWSYRTHPVFYLDDIRVEHNLLTNPGFETGNFAGWSHQSGYLCVLKEYPHSGRWAARCAGYYGDNFRLSQTFRTIPGQSYEVSLWYLGGTNYDQLQVNWAGIKIFYTYEFAANSHYRLVSSAHTATDATTTLEILYGQGYSKCFYFDDIQVKPVQNLVVNGSFETGDFSGWNIQNDPSKITLAVKGYEPFDGHWSAYGQKLNPGSVGRLSQTFATTPGKSYRVSFWREGGAEDNNTNHLKAYWNGSEIPSINSSPHTGIWQYSCVSSTQVATGSSATLEFVFDPGTSSAAFFLDNVQVNPVSAITASRPGKAHPEIELLLLE